MNDGRKFGICELCGREIYLTFHHLIPKKLHRRIHFRKHFSREELNSGIDVCRQCHSGLHDLYDEMTLAKHFSTIESLRCDESIMRHVSWVRRQKS